MRLAFVPSVLFASLGLSGAAAAADLKIDGQTTVEKALGDSLSLTVSGTVGKPVSLLVDVSAGPVSAFGRSLPLGFTPLLVILPLGSVPAGGTLTVADAVPDFAPLAGNTLHFLAAVHDEAFPFGLDFSGGASLSIVPKPTAGASQATLV
ncbi:MAG: hypothetical protein ACF8XB_00615, partial [Planctomycetota bacterium JB042]